MHKCAFVFLLLFPSYIVIMVVDIIVMIISQARLYILLCLCLNFHLSQALSLPLLFAPVDRSVCRETLMLFES